MPIYVVQMESSSDSISLMMLATQLYGFLADDSKFFLLRKEFLNRKWVLVNLILADPAKSQTAGA